MLKAFVAAVVLVYFSANLGNLCQENCMDVDWGWLVAFKLDTTHSIDHSQQCCFMLFHVAFLKCLLLCNVNHHHEPFEKYLWATAFKIGKWYDRKHKSCIYKTSPVKWQRWRSSTLWSSTLELGMFGRLFLNQDILLPVLTFSIMKLLPITWNKIQWTYFRVQDLRILAAPILTWFMWTLTSRNQSLCGIDVANENHVDQGKILQYREMFWLSHRVFQVHIDTNLRANGFNFQS